MAEEHQHLEVRLADGRVFELCCACTQDYAQQSSGGAPGKPVGIDSAGKIRFTPLPYYKQHPVLDVLDAAKAMFEERGQLYDGRGEESNNGYLVAGKIMNTLTSGNDWMLETDQQFAVYHCLTILVGKLVRFANSGFTHEDSMRDVVNYAAMIASMLTTEGASIEQD